MGSSAVARLRRVPAWAWLVAIVAASFLLRAWLARSMVAPFIMVDELIYSELARSVVDDGSFAVRGAATSGYSLLYPLLIAPAYALFDELPRAYGAVKTINALAMSLAAVPAYLIGRRVVAPPLALLGALLAVAVPSLAYTGTVMTENLYYPVFLTVVLALLRTVDRPSWSWTAVLLALLAVAYAVRSQTVALIPAVATAPLLVVLFERGGWRGLRAYWRPFAALATGGLAVVVFQLVRGQSLQDLLGAYSIVGDRSYEVDSVLRFWAWHLEELAFFVAVVPVAATLVLVGLVRSLPRPLQVHLAVTVATVVWVSLVVAAFASEFANRIQERNLFVVAPLLFTAMLAWVERGAPRPPRIAGPAVIAAMTLPILVPYERFIETGAISDTLALLLPWTINTHLLAGSYAATVAVVAVAVGALILLVPARYAIVLPLLVLAFLVVVSRVAWSGPHGFVQASEGALFQGIRGVPRDWIDRTVPAGREVGVLWTGRADRFSVNLNEFFNRRVGRVFYTDQPTPGGINETPVSLIHGNGFLVADGVYVLPNDATIELPYMLLDGTVTPVGTRIALDQTPLGGMALWKIDRALRETVAVTGLYPRDTWSGRSVTWMQRPCRGGSLAVRMSSDPSLHRGPVTVTATTNGISRTVHVVPSGTVPLRLPLVPKRGRCVVRFSVSPTANPSRVIAGSTDDRELGVHFDAMRVDR